MGKKEESNRKNQKRIPYVPRNRFGLDLSLEHIETNRPKYMKNYMRDYRKLERLTKELQELKVRNVTSLLKEDSLMWDRIDRLESELRSLKQRT